MGRGYDVGARWAGASTAMLLARRGLEVLLVDRASFPSEIPHGHFIHRGGQRLLRDWQLLERITAAGGPAVTTFTLDTGHSRLVGSDLTADGIAGAEVRENFVVEGYAADDTRVTGIRGRGTGEWCIGDDEHATLGADGRGSCHARAVRAQEYEVTPTLTCYWADVSSSSLKLYARDRRLIFAFPPSAAFSRCS